MSAREYPPTMTYALRYTRLGWPLVPIEPGAKRPKRTTSPQRFEERQHRPVDDRALGARLSLEQLGGGNRP